MDPSRPEQNSPPDDRIAGLIDEYFDRRQSGEKLTPAQFAAEHSELADELEPYLEGLSLLSGIDIADGAEPPADESIDEGELPQIEGYELQQELGRGGMGVAYRALQVSTKRIVALKVMLAGPFASPSSRRRFEREVELAARLQHPSIVRVLESGRVAQQQYFSMDYVEGTPLDQYVSTAQPDARTILGIFRRICAAVEYAHQHGVVHRDLKPANVLIDAEGEPHILDFGLAKAIGQIGHEESLITEISGPGQVMGTLPYLSPEQASGRTDEVDARTDVYSLGVMLYEALTGSLPHNKTASPSEVIRKIVEEAPPPPSSLSHRVDGEIETIILKTLEKEKERRYQTAEGLAEDIRRYVEGEPVLARRPSSLYILRKKLRKHRMPVSVVTAIIALILIGLFFTSWQRRHAFVEARRDAVHLQRMLEAGFESRLLRLAQDLYAHHPDLPEAPLVCAQALYRNEDTRLDAIPFLQNELQRDPSCWACRNLLMEIYQAKGDLNLAAGLRAEIEKTTPDTSDAWYVRSFATFDLPTALHCAIEAVNRAPDHVPSWYRLTYLKLVTNDLTGAIAGAERLIELGEDRADWTFFKGNMLASLGRFHEAIEQYSMVIDLTSGLDRGYMRRAHAYRRIKDYERAIEDYTRVLETSDAPTTVAWYLCQRAAPLRMLGRPEEALADYDRVRDLLEPPSYADARAFLILKELGRDDAADEVLTQALADVQDPWLRQIFLCLAGQVTPQRLIGDALASGNPDQRCEAFYYAGEVSLLAGQLEDARTLLQRCVQAGVEAGPGTPLGTFKEERELAEWRLSTLFPDSPDGSGEEN